MEDNQNTEQLVELNTSKLPRSIRSPQSAALNPLFKLLKRYHWLVLIGVWAFLLAIASISIRNLIQANPVAGQKVTTPVAAKNSAEPFLHISNHTPLWLLGAVVTFAAGSLVIVKRLNSASQGSSVRVRKRRQQEPPVLTLLESEPLPPVVPVTAETEPVDTMLPPAQSHPLDALEESLAEKMDIRKHRPLSSFLPESQEEKG